jgi:amino acid adenylation domain-containing protein
MPPLTLPGLRVRVEEIYAGVSRFDLTLALGETAAGFAGTVEYSTDLFDATRIERLSRHLGTLLGGALAAPAARLADLPLLDSAERHQLLIEGDQIEGDRTAGAGRDATGHERFAEQAARTPAAVALRWSDGDVSYGELARRSNRLAHGMGACRVDPGRAVAVLLDAGPEQVTALLAVLKAGCHFVCLDASHPAARLELVLDETRPSAILVDGSTLSAHSALLQRIQGSHGSRLLCLGGSLPDGLPDDLDLERLDAARLALLPAGEPRIPVRPDAPVYLVYTSGSTGRPKGILQSHRSFCQYLDWRARRFAIGPGAFLFQWASITYDAAYCEIFSGLGSGATLVMAEPAVRYAPRALVRRAVRERITHLKFVPSFGRHVVESLAEMSREERDLRSLRFLELSGEPLPVELAVAWRESLGTGPRVFNMYGPSEMILATWFEVGELASGQPTVPIGAAIGGRQILVLDRQGGLCPSGVRGEIWVRSPYLTLGYFERAEETASVFVPNPLDPTDEVLCFRTGDLGWWRSDGTLEFGGRRDQQIKIRGMRVEPGEIEAVLGGHHEVTECAVVAREVAPGDLRLVAHVVAAHPVAPGELHAFLCQRLPATMVPSGYVFLDALPRTRTGKVDRRALPDDTGGALVTETVYMAPRSPTEANLAAIFAELLAVPRVGVDDSFFALGGHSLLATRALARVRSAFGVEISLRRFFAGPTIAELAVAIAESRLAKRDERELARLLEQLERLTEQEACELLATGPRGSGHGALEPLTAEDPMKEA